MGRALLRSSPDFPELCSAAVVLSRMSSCAPTVLSVRVNEVIGSTGVAEGMEPSAHGKPEAQPASLAPV